MVSRDGLGQPADLRSQYPGRSSQLTTLHSLFCRGCIVPPHVHIQDANSPASTHALVHGVLQQSGDNVIVTVDPLLCPQPKVLFTTVMQQARQQRGGQEDHYLTSNNSDLLSVFLDSLSTFAVACSRGNAKLLIVIQRAERIRDMWTEPVIEAILRLPELISSKGTCSVLTISTLSTSHFRTIRGTGLDDAVEITLPRLSSEAAISSLSLDGPKLIDSDTRQQKEDRQALLRLHAAFTAVAYDTFASDIRDLEEIRLLSCCVWYPFVEPALQGTVSIHRIPALLSRSAYLFRDALARLSTRMIGPTQWVEEMVESVAIDCQSQGQGQAGLAKAKREHNEDVVSLPLLQLYLLLASFIASYNPAKVDLRYFLRNESALTPAGGDDPSTPGSRRKRRRIKRRVPASAHLASESSGRNRQEMLGPKSFPLDRVLSILQALLTEVGPDVVPTWLDEDESQTKSDWWEAKSKSVGVMEAVNALVQSGMLVRVSSADRLDSALELRTNVTLDRIRQISKRAAFDLDGWLWDYN